MFYFLIDFFSAFMAGNMYIAIFCLPGCDVMNFEIIFIFLIKPFSLHDQKVRMKTYISWE